MSGHPYLEAIFSVVSMDYFLTLKLQQTPGTTPDPKNLPVHGLEISSDFSLLWYLGSVPGVCWIFLRHPQGLDQEELAIRGWPLFSFSLPCNSH